MSRCITDQTSGQKLTKGQLAIINLARYEAKEKIEGESVKRIAEKSGVDARNVSEIRAIRNKGVPEVERMVMEEGLSLSMADTFVQDTPKDKQAEIVKGGIEAVKARYHEIRAERQVAIERRKIDKKRQEFKEFSKRVADDTAAALAKIQRRREIANGGCLLPNCAAKFCNDCKWGFDVYLPIPNAPCCPYCGGNNLSKRDDEWNPRELI